MNAEISSENTLLPRSTLIAGVALVMIGLLTLVSQFLELDQLELLFLPALALIFLVWGSLTRNIGLIIPGGVLAGIGLGSILITGPFQSLSDEKSGGVFFLAFAAGWVLITIVSAIFTRPTQWWPLIVAGIMSLIGGALLAGGRALEILEFSGKVWPLVLVAAGIWLLLRRKPTRIA